MSSEQDPWAPPTPGPAPPTANPPPLTYAPPAPPGSPTPYAPAGPAYGYPTYVPVPAGPTRTDPVSVAALVCGCLLLAPLALLLGIAGVVRTRQPGLGGRGLAVAGIVLGVVGGLVWVVAAATIVFLRSDAGQDVVGLATGDRVYVGDLARGDCFQTPEEDDAIDLIDTVDCSLPHDLEVFLVRADAFTPAADGAPYPGTTSLDEQATALCKGSFEAFVGLPYDNSILDFYVVFPSEESWNSFDDRAIICAVGDPAKQTSGTLEGSQL